MNLYSPKQIRALRQSLDLTVVQFAKKLGVVKESIYNWERGTSHPTYGMMVKLNALAMKHSKATA